MELKKVLSTKFQKGFEEQCFKLITKAYTSAIETKVIELDWDENDITSELHEHVMKSLVKLSWPIYVSSEQPLRKDGVKKRKGFANKRARIDLTFSEVGSPLKCKYHMEAKRLKEKDSGLKRRYIDTGIDNFVSKKYENGCLLGYVLEGDLHRTVNGINKLLKKDDRESEFLKAKAYMLHNFYFESDHENSFILKHFMFDFTLLHSA